MRHKLSLKNDLQYKINSFTILSLPYASTRGMIRYPRFVMDDQHHDLILNQKQKIKGDDFYEHIGLLILSNI